jgi:hypothetical protein
MQLCAPAQQYSQWTQARRGASPEYKMYVLQFIFPLRGDCMNIEEVASLVSKAMSEHSHTKSFCIRVMSDNNTIKLLGQVSSYYQKSLVITVALKACPGKEVVFDDVVVARPSE